MKLYRDEKDTFILIAFFVFAISSSQEYTVLHINSSWNWKKRL